MKIFLNTLFFFFILFLFENSAYSLSDYQIKEICQKKSKRSTCIKKLKLQKLNLLQGNKIEIPVIPFNK
jgi:hypothetical protein